MRRRPTVCSLILITTILVAGWNASATAAEDDHANVVIVLDASGSMCTKMRTSSVLRIDAAKAALREVLKQVPQDTHIGLLVFSAGNLSNDWVYPLGPRDDERLIAAINRPEPRHSTPLGAYIKKAADRLIAQRESQHGYGSYRLLIVTDGEATDREVMERYVPLVIARGLTVDVIGVDMESQHTLATRVHSYRRADDPEALTRAVAEVFAEVAGDDSAAADDDAFADIEPLPGEMAMAMIDALATARDNSPIGSSVRQASRPRPGHSHGAASPSRPMQQPGTPPSGSHLRVIIVVCFAIAVGVGALRAAARMGRR